MQLIKVIKGELRMNKIAYVFPGQGSQAVGMGKSVAEEDSHAKRIFEQADNRLGYSLSDIIFNGPIETLTLTMHNQHY